MNSTAGLISSTETQRHTYWFCSAIILWLDVFAFAFLAREYCKPKSPLRQPFFKPFQLEILGDAIYVILVYLPYHTYNAVNALFSEHPEPIGEESCLGIWGFLTLFSLISSLTSKTWIWFETLNSFRSLGKLSSDSNSNQTRNFICVCLFFTSVWFAIGTTTEEIGVAGGFYCSVRTFRGFTGVFFFLYVAVNASFQMYFMRKAYMTIKSVLETTQGSFNSMSDVSIRNAALKNISMLSLRMTVGFYVVWGPITLWTIFNVMKLDFSAVMFMIASWLVKIQPLVDIYLVFKAPPFQKRKKVFASSVVGTPDKTIETNEGS